MKGISETAFASQVEDLLKLFGWRWTHFRPAWSSKGYRTPIKGDKGFPDYCCVRPPRLLFIELKDQYTKSTPEQEGWLEDLGECCKIIHNLTGREPTIIPEVYLFRPADIERIMEILK